MEELIPWYAAAFEKTSCNSEGSSAVHHPQGVSGQFDKNVTQVVQYQAPALRSMLIDLSGF
jgi:hypothetical protein